MNSYRSFSDTAVSVKNTVSLSTVVPDCSVRPVEWDSLLDGRVIPEEVDLKSMFGNRAEFVTETGKESRFEKLSIRLDGHIYDTSIALVILVLYAFILTVYRNVIPVIFNAWFYRYSANKIMESLDINIDRVFTLSNILFLFSLSAFLSSLVKYWFFEQLPEGVGSHLFSLILGIVILLILYRIMMQYIVRYLSGSEVFFAKLRFYNRLTFTFGALVFTPLVLLCCFVPSGVFIYFKYVVIVAFLLLFVQYAVQQCRLFVEEKVSFLQYILYFCTVEIIPVSFILIYAYRKFLI